MDDGLPIHAQVAPRPIGVLLGLQGSRNPFSFTPAYGEIQDLSLADRVARMREPAFRGRLLDEVQWPQRGYKKRVTEWHLMFPFGDPPDYEPAPDQSVAAIAARTGQQPAEVALDLLLQRDGKELVYMPLLNYSDFNFEPIREMSLHPNTVLSLSDGGAHCGVICDAGTPTFLLTHWARD